jgi:hypothetical protein
MVEDTEEKKAEEPRDPWAPVKVQLTAPIDFGEGPVSELELKPMMRAFKDASIIVGPEGTKFDPYQLAIVGLKMAGHFVGATKFVDKLHPRDAVKLSEAVTGFLG